MNFLENHTKLVENWKALDKNDNSQEIVNIAQDIRKISKERKLETDEILLKLKRQIEKQERLDNPEKFYNDFVYLIIKQTTSSLQHWTKALKDSRRIFRFWI